MTSGSSSKESKNVILACGVPFLSSHMTVTSRNLSSGVEPSGAECRSTSASHSGSNSPRSDSPITHPYMS